MTGEVNELQGHLKVRSAGFRCSLKQELRVRAKKPLRITSSVVLGHMGGRRSHCLRWRT